MTLDNARGNGGDRGQSERSTMCLTVNAAALGNLRSQPLLAIVYKQGTAAPGSWAKPREEHPDRLYFLLYTYSAPCTIYGICLAVPRIYDLSQERIDGYCGWDKENLF